MTRYVIFGNGRVGTNMTAYLTALDHKVSLISRQQAETDRASCVRLVKDADIIAAALPDDKLSDWFADWSAELIEKITIHFSGAVTVSGMVGFHPLYSFPQSSIAPEAMKAITFACPAKRPAFQKVFPTAPNPHFTVDDADRARYHALAVLSGNLASFVWNETAKELSTLSGLAPEKILATYLNSVVDRFIESPTSSLTGPIARRDEATVRKNLKGLEGSEILQGLYKAFLNASWPAFDMEER